MLYLCRSTNANLGSFRGDESDEQTPPLAPGPRDCARLRPRDARRKTDRVERCLEVLRTLRPNALRYGTSQSCLFMSAQSWFPLFSAKKPMTQPDSREHSMIDGATALPML